MSTKQFLLEQIQNRELVYQFTGTDLKELLDNIKVAYIGMDATAPSIHAGYLIPIVLARLLAEHGIKIIVLLGGATSKVGDPTGKNQARTMLSDDQIKENSQGILKAIHKFFPSAEIVNNNDWLSGVSLMDYLQNIAPYVSVNGLIASEIFANRLKIQSHLSLLELNYPILQGYDFWHLFTNKGCNLQFGGSDQWANILMGVDLVAKKEKKQVYGLTCPLLLTSDGKKMGKSEKGAVWLDENLFSPYDFWQYWRNIDDECCGRYLNILLGLRPLEDINESKKLLASKLTEFVHGKEEAEKALRRSIELFEHNNLSELEKIEVSNGELFEIVAQIFSESKAASKRLIEQGGVKVDEQVETNPYMLMEKGRIAVLCKGKKQFARITCV